MSAASSAAMPKQSPKGRPVWVWAVPMPTGRAGLGAGNWAELKRCSSLVPITGHWLQRAVVAMCVSGGACNHRDAQTPRKPPFCRAKRNWTPFWEYSSKVADPPTWYDRSPRRPLPCSRFLSLASPTLLCAFSVLPAAGSPCAQALL
jgi:hypothetical protein